MTSGLSGSRCQACGATAYPEQAACPRCGEAASPVELSSVGELWTWTVQRYAPKSPPYVPPPDGFRPFALGYVELPEGVRVAAIVDTDDLASVHIGMKVRLRAGKGVPRATVIPEEVS
jgi:uncharacterized OB-fold protein